MIKAVVKFAILASLIASCTKHDDSNVALSFTFDGKREIFTFDQVSSKSFSNCGVQENEISILQGDRFFKINWNEKGQAWFWYTYHGKSVAYTTPIFNLINQGNTAVFYGGIVRDGYLKFKP